MSREEVIILWYNHRGSREEGGWQGKGSHGGPRPTRVLQLRLGEALINQRRYQQLLKRRVFLGKVDTDRILIQHDNTSGERMYP